MQSTELVDSFGTGHHVTRLDASYYSMSFACGIHKKLTLRKLLTQEADTRCGSWSYGSSGLQLVFEHTPRDSTMIGRFDQLGQNLPMPRTGETPE